MNGKKIISLFCFLCFSCVCSKSLTQKSEVFANFCTVETATSRGYIAVQDCFSAGRVNNESRKPINIDNIEARWSASTVNEDNKLLLSVSFSARGSGQVKLHLISSSRHLFCGILQKSAKQQNAISAVNVWLKCDQRAFKANDKMKLVIDKMEKKRRRRRRETNEIEVDLPGCFLPEFRNTVVCQKQAEEKIRFHLRRISNRRSIRVVLSRSVYKSRLEDEERAKARRYNVALLEEPPADVWMGAGAGTMLQMVSLNYPERSVRFRGLALKETYVIAVWRNGEMKRYAKKITIC